MECFAVSNEKRYLKNGIMVLPIGGVFTFIENFKVLSVSLI